MHFLIRSLLSGLSLTALFFSITQLADYWDYEDAPADIHQLMTAKIDAKDLERALNKSLSEERIDDASMYLHIAKKHQYSLNYVAYQKAIDQQSTSFARVKRNSKQFTQGFIQGKSTTSAGIAGAITADLTVIGDVRDLNEQYQRQQKNQPVDELIVSLAGAGIGLTVLTYSSAGTTSMVKAGTSIIKLAAKTKHLTRSFSREILQQSKRVFNWKLFKQSLHRGSSINDVQYAAKKAFSPKALKPLQQSAEQLYTIKKSTNIADTLHLLRYVENGGDLRRLQKFTSKQGKLSKGYLRLLGKGILRGARVIRKTVGFLFSVLSTLMSFFLSVIFMFSYKKKKVMT
ncbi:MAG: hypothetical protein KAH22_05855 [Thiotrichaceae bacterium]|nr:hypothetical protein [Thiotrichaceae bacterium]